MQDRVFQFEQSSGSEDPSVLRSRVLSVIGSKLEELGLARAGELDPKTIYFPFLKRGAGIDTKRNLEDSGLLDFSVVVVTDNLVGRNEIGVSATIEERSVADYDFLGYKSRRRVVRNCFLNLDTRPFLNRRIQLSVLPGVKRENSPSSLPTLTSLPDGVNYHFLDEDVSFGSTDGIEKQLLIVDGPRVRVSSLDFPKGWRRVVRNGRLIEEETVQKEDNEIVEYDPELAESVRKFIRSREPYNDERFEELRKMFEQFSRYNGPALGKEKVRVGAFGDESTPVEIAVDDMDIYVDFFGLDTALLKRRLEEPDFNQESLAGCFKAEASSGTDRLMFNIRLGWPDVSVTGKLERWDVGKGQFVDSTEALGLGYQEWRILHLTEKGVKFNRVLEDENLLPFLLSQLRGRSKGSGWGLEGLSIEEVDQRQRERRQAMNETSGYFPFSTYFRRGEDTYRLGGYRYPEGSIRWEEPERDFRAQNESQSRPDPNALFVTPGEGLIVRLDTQRDRLEKKSPPEVRARYWANKAQRQRELQARKNKNKTKQKKK